MAAKAASLVVDQVMLDLEDAVTPSAKPEARGQVVDALRRFDWSGKIVSVRVNASSTTWFDRDVEEVVRGAGDRIDTVVLPKVESAASVRALSLMLSRIERERGWDRRIGIEPQIESARGLCAAEDIASADDRVESLTFGPADFAGSIGSPVLTIGGAAEDYPGHVWHYALARIVVAAKAAGRAAIDGPLGVLKDEAQLARSANIARALGCDGKWAIHPDQVPAIQRIFTPSAEELARARRISDHYAAMAKSSGATSYEGELLDAASLRLAAGILLRAGDESSER